MDYFALTAGLSREEADDALAPLPEEITHFVEDQNGLRARVHKAICGEPIHSRLMRVRSSGTPSCQKCRDILDEFNSQGVEF